MGLQFRKRIKIGPFSVNLLRRGASTSVNVGEVSVNSRSRCVRVNLPGPFAWQSSAAPRRSREKNYGRSFPVQLVSVIVVVAIVILFLHVAAKF